MTLRLPAVPRTYARFWKVGILVILAVTLVLMEARLLGQDVHATDRQPVGTIDFATSEAAGASTIPIYQTGSIRFFSAGVGITERQAIYASYPPYALKLVFAEESGAYLTGVAVTILDAEGTRILEVPLAHVTGPWLFIDLPPGASYTVIGVRAQHPPVKKRVHLHTPEITVVYLHWPPS